MMTIWAKNGLKRSREKMPGVSTGTSGDSAERGSVLKVTIIWGLRIVAADATG